MTTLRYPLFVIDPGLGGSGYALWMGAFNDLPCAIGTVHPKRGEPLVERFETVGYRLLQVTKEWPAEGGTVAIEWPAIYYATAKSVASAAKGDILKLTALIGVIGSYFTRNGWTVVHIPVVEWKGQLEKPVTKFHTIKFLKAINKAWAREVVAKGYPSHVWDALGISLYVRGDAPWS